MTMPLPEIPPGRAPTRATFGTEIARRDRKVEELTRSGVYQAPQWTLDDLLNPPRFTGFQTTNTGLWGGWIGSFVMDLIEQDSHGGWVSDHYVVQKAGTYWAQGNLLTSKGGTFRSTGLAKNGTRIRGSIQDAAVSPDYTNLSSKAILIHLDVGDYLTMAGFNGGGSASTWNVGFTDLGTRLDIYWVCP